MKDSEKTHKFSQTQSLHNASHQTIQKHAKPTIHICFWVKGGINPSIGKHLKHGGVTIGILETT
jgi:hypothetical protein